MQIDELFQGHFEAKPRFYRGKMHPPSLSDTVKIMQQKSEKKKWHVYIIKCADTTLYTGITTDIIQRLREHNGEIKGGAKYTRFKRPVVLVYQEEVADRSSASIREYELKRLSREEKIALTTTPT